MGQSLCDGSESLPIVTPQDTGWGNLSFKRGVRTWLPNDHPATPAARPADQFSLVPLAAAANGGLGETIANGLADHLSAAAVAFQKPAPAAARPAHLVAYAGQGGRTIEELAIADLSTDPRTPKEKQAGGGYYQTSLDDARRATAQARTAGRPFHIAALVWMQGEGNGGATGGLHPARWEAELPRPAGQAWYRDRLIAYRRQWSTDLRAITGQQGEIPLFTYQTLGPAGAAQLMAADDDPHIHLVGPHYMVPSAINSRRPGGLHGAPIHLSADGERWFGEQVGKVIHRVLHQGEAWQPLRPLAATIAPGRASLLIDFHVPRPPLVLDTAFLPLQHVSTGPEAHSSLAGFQVRDEAGALMPLASIHVEPPARLRLRLARPLPSGMKYHLSCGAPQAGVLGRVLAVRPAPAAAVPATDLILAGPPPPVLARLLEEGAFPVSNQAAGAAHAQAPVRAVHTGSDPATGAATTHLRFEDRELRNATPFAPGQPLTAMRPYAYCNLRDSDAEPSLHTFADPAYGRRQGRPYPLWNWCVLFTDFPIAGP